MSGNLGSLGYCLSASPVAVSKLLPPFVIPCPARMFSDILPAVWNTARLKPRVFLVVLVLICSWLLDIAEVGQRLQIKDTTEHGQPVDSC